MMPGFIAAPDTCSSYVLWSKTTKNPDVSTGSLTRPYAHALARLTRLLRTAHFALLASLARSAVLIRLLARSLTPEPMGK